MSNLSKKHAQTHQGTYRAHALKEMAGRYCQPGVPSLQQNKPTRIDDRGGIQEEQKRKEEEYFRYKALVLAANPQTTIFSNTNIISLHVPGEFFCRMMQTSDLNHTLDANSHFGG